MTALSLATLGALGVTACSGGGPAGLGRKACPYVRPRLVRVDRDRLQGPRADLQAVARDVDLYIGQLPAAGKARADRQLVRFASALDSFALAGSDTGPDPRGLDAAEAALKRLCGVAP